MTLGCGESEQGSPAVHCLQVLLSADGLRVNLHCACLPALMLLFLRLWVVEQLPGQVSYLSEGLCGQNLRRHCLLAGLGMLKTARPASCQPGQLQPYHVGYKVTALNKSYAAYQGPCKVASQKPPIRQRSRGR